jgi:hypothetical protein
MPPTTALGSGPLADVGELGFLGFPAAECETDSSWASRPQGRTPTQRLDCVHALPSAGHELKVSHLRRALARTEGLDDSTGVPLTYPGLSLVPAGESSSSLDLAGSWRAWNYAFEFDMEHEARIDDGRFQQEDRAELRFKTGLDLGLVRSRLELSGSHSADEAEPELTQGFERDRERTVKAGGRAFLDLVVPSLPVVTLSIGREQTEVSRGRTIDRVDADSDVVSGAIWYGRPQWQAYTVSSVYSLRGDRFASGSVLYDQYVSGSFWPTSTLTISPALNISRASYDGRASWQNTLSASLGVYSSGIWKDGLVTLWTGYDQSSDTAHTFDYQQVHLSVGGERTIGGLGWLEGYEISFGGTLGYSHYLDRLNPSESGPGFRSFLTLRISAL